ncbi:hypothetical protein GOEFS_070_00150 [Gordonia effusa NBRC 100432]|uniref:Uncharacterized protein n=1 Tax=Gordonia effusa NBRC 100432 TaxID=1077974 RepID=H0R1I0_9ACTN|nr:hypothetical protein [Gordonia effusa]GAB18931.1 hypothetical protein GOEFS_070_00150 [Gordonia effusa NBRC 100432]
MSNLHIDDDATDGWLIAAARELDPPIGEVERLISSITTTMTNVIRPARSLGTDVDGVLVSDRVVKTLLATRIRSQVGRLVVYAQVLVNDEDDVTGARIGLVARYRDDLPAMSDRVRDVVEDVLVATIGEYGSASARTNIHVRWQDVYSRDWLN